MSLRWRIAIGLAVIAALVCALGAATAYVTTRNRLESTVDDSLLAGARAAEFRPGTRSGGPTGGPSGGVTVFGGCPPPGVIGGSAAQVIEDDGTKTPCFIGSLTLPYNGSDQRLDVGEAGLRSVRIDGTDYRLLTLPRADGTTFQVARSLAENENVLSSLRLQLLLISLIGIVAAAVLGWFFARRIVRPIERLRDTAEQIARTQDLDAPIPASGAGEVGSLAGSFSTMVGALAESKRQQQQLVADASHELRTPLTSLRTNAELLDRTGALTPDQRDRAVQGIRLEVNELTDLVSELVELATDKADDEVPEPVALAGLAEDVVARTRRRTGREIDVHVDGAAGTAFIGPHAVDRALSNLVENAVKYSPGAIEVVVRGQQVEVLDRGPGIAPGDQAHVFDRFYRAATARTEPGSGLGLAIVQQIVERQGGRVWARSRDGGGAAVGFELPPAPS